MSDIQVTIVTPTGLKFSGYVQEISIPGESGEMGIMPDHVPLVATSRPGIVRYTDSTKKNHFLVVDSGMVQIDSNQVELLVQRAKTLKELESSELDHEIDHLTELLQEHGLTQPIYEMRRKQLTYFEKMRELKEQNPRS